MVASSLQKYEGVLYPFLKSSPGQNTTAISQSNFISNDAMKGRVMVAMSLSFLAGIMQIALGILHLGFVTKYLSDAIVNGFTCGSAYHVVISQINTLLGITLGTNNLVFVLIGVRLDIKNILK